MWTRNTLLAACLIALLFLFSGAEPAPAEGGRPDCRCIDGNGCWHYLRAPVAPPEDVCSCEFCDQVTQHDGTRDLPRSWSRACASGGSLNAFLHRHAASWRLSCSERDSSTRGCAGSHKDNCPECSDAGDWDSGGRDQIKRQLEIEKRLLGFEPIIIQSPHFYLVTDVKKHKLFTQKGSPRVIGGHEFAHIYIERLEKAYAEFSRKIGTPGLPKRAGVFILDKKSAAEVVQARYMGNPRTNLVYGGSSSSPIANGHCANGFVTNMQEQRDDRQLHATVRHLTGHLLISCWTVVNGNDKHLPRWMFVGAAHWLSKSHPQLREHGTYCGNESTALSDSHRKWDQKARKLAASGRREPIEQLFGANTTNEMNRFSMHLRAWSFFDVYLEDDRERYVAFLQRLRRAEEHRPAMEAAMKTDPPAFDERWAERLLGKRPSAAPTAKEIDEADPDAPGARVRADIRAAIDDPIRLAALVRGLVEIKEVRTAATVLPLLGHSSTLVRETAVVVFGRTKDAKVREFMRTTGIGSGSPLIRANVVRAIGLSGDKDAADAIIEALEDSNWLVQANACRSIAQLRDERAAATLIERISKSSPKVRIAAMDALTAFPDSFERASIPVSGELGSRQWQLRVTAAQTLGEMGQMSTVEDLIARMEVEAGRVREECHAALKKITYDDLGMKPKHWRDWWDKERERARGRGMDTPARPPAPKDPKGEGYGVPETGEPAYYGIRVFSESIGYVLDISTSMEARFVPSAATMRRTGRTYQAKSKIGVAKEELIQSIENLDPRASFNVTLFRTTVHSWKNSPVPASESNKSRAISMVRNTQANATAGQGETNYYDALLEVLALKNDEAPGAGFNVTPDTIFFLTDGTPTRGDITSTDELISWFREENRFSRMRCHVIAIGNSGVDLHFLSTLAKQNDGVFVHLSE